MQWPARVAIISGVILFIIAGVGAMFFTFRPVTLRIAVGPVGSEDMRVIHSIAQGFALEKNNIRLRIVPAEGTSTSAALLGRGEADLAVVRGDQDLPKDVRAIAILRKNVVTLWAPSGLRNGAKTKSGKADASEAPGIEKLAGRKIGLIGNSPANAVLLKLILAQYGVAADRVTITQFSTAGVADAVRSQKADAFMAVGPVNSDVTIQAIAASVRGGGEPVFLAINAAEAIAQNRPIYEPVEIPAGAFGAIPPRPDEAVKTIGFAHYIVARKELSDAVAGAFTRQLFAVRQNVLSEFPRVAKIETPDTEKDAAIPAHPGAAAYIDGEERTFFDRYSDLMWGGLMLFSVLGSAGAWFASYVRRDERTANHAERERLLDMIGIARTTSATDELDRLQLEADQILRDTLACFEHGVIDEGVLTAFNIALDQFHNAVADRREVLNAQLSALRSAAQLRA